MTVQVFPVSYLGFFTGKVLNITLNHLEGDFLKVWVDGILQTNGVDYYVSRESNQLNTDPAVKDSVEITFTNPISDLLVKVEVDGEYSQTIEYSAQQTVDTAQLEYSLDKLTLLLQDTNDKIVAINVNAFPDSRNQQYGNIVVTDGNNAYGFFSLKLPPVTAQDARGVLTVDPSLKTFAYTQIPSISNPQIPTPTALTPTLTPLIVSGGQYALGTPLPDTGAFTLPFTIAVYDKANSRWIGKDADILNGIALPQPTKESQVLISETTATGIKPIWDDFSYTKILHSSGVINGLVITKTGTNTIGISAGNVLVVENTEVIPKITVVPFAGEASVPIPTAGTSHFVYLDCTNINAPVITTNANYIATPRGNLICLAEIEHTLNGAITFVSVDYKILDALPSQMLEVIWKIIGNTFKGSLQYVTQNGNQIKYTAGVFYGYDVNANTNKLLPHEVSIPAKSPATFRWRNQLDVDSPIASTIDVNNLKYEATVGVLTNVQSEQWVQVLCWIYPDGELVLQYPKQTYQSQQSMPDALTFVRTRAYISPLAERNAAGFAVLRLQRGGDFGDHVIENIQGIRTGGVAGSTVIGAPIVTPTDVGKVQTVSASGQWVTSSFAIPAPTTQDIGKALVATGVNAYGFGSTSDDLARVYLNNGVISGMVPVTILASNTSISIPTGTLVFMTDAEGKPTAVQEKIFPAVAQFDLTDISTTSVTYIYVTSDLQLHETHTRPDFVRGDSILLYEIVHADRTRIEEVRPMFNVLNATPRQDQSLWDAVGIRVKNLQIAPTGEFTLGHQGFKAYGRNIGLE